MSEVSTATIANESAQRRTFAIISHPDAGKTTLTEKLLLYSGMVRTAGMVRGRKGSKATSSDWMKMEQERGISISASAMQFRYKNAVINVLDTPGHQDFSEDTYRTLTAADSAVMVIDAAKGVEAQTRKLFTVCRLRGIPILTFINKMDLPGREPLDLMHEVEQVLQIKASPRNWPIGYGKNFCGVVDVESHVVHLFERSAQGGSAKAIIKHLTLAEFCETWPDKDIVSRLKEDLELLGVAGNPFTREAFLGCEVTPVFFGSALTNFGVEPFFDAFVDLASAPRARKAKNSAGEEIIVEPGQEGFSGFVFKIQSNMDARHRDSMAFVRVCSGAFERDAVVKNQRTQKELRLARSYSMLARDRNTIDLAFPGDVVGVINPGDFAIGDTLASGSGFEYPPIPRFAPEVFAQVRANDVLRHKSFEKGIEQLGAEGTVQILSPYEVSGMGVIVGAVGKLQFDVLQYRLRDEYSVETTLELLPYQYSAYLIGDPKLLKKTLGSMLAVDRHKRVLVLFKSEWERNYTLEQNPQHGLEDLSG